MRMPPHEQYSPKNSVKFRAFRGDPAPPIREANSIIRIDKTLARSHSIVESI